MIKNNYKVLQELLKHCMYLALAGALIGAFHTYDLYISILLCIICIFLFVVKLKQKNRQKWVYIIGMLLSAGCGIFVENMGIKNHYWEYHNLSNNRTFPYWLPFAWALAFIFVYRVESCIIQIKKIKSLNSKLLVALYVSFFFPAFGEMISIYMGVWTYNWPMQVLGVPLYALILLPVFHMIINTTLYIICKKGNIQDNVFSSTKF
jgi:high-affinity Fe2+/Pb2+ permease